MIKPGDGCTYPQVGQKISCHYVLTLTSGKKVDSSRDRGKPFQFMLGRGEVIEGWDKGLLKMSVGERSKLTVPSNMGYGAMSIPGIPANSTLLFDVELLKVE